MNDSFLNSANKKNPIVTIPNLKARAANGDAFWTIISPDMNADDHNSMNSKGKVFIIIKDLYCHKFLN